ncbi:MAG: hypothetical protein Q9187_009495, partial [Circinaria calcarea]
FGEADAMLVSAGFDEITRGNVGVGGEYAVGEAEGDESGGGIEGLGAEREDVAEAFGGAVLADYGIVGGDTGELGVSGGLDEVGDSLFRIIDDLQKERGGIPPDETQLEIHLLGDVDHGRHDEVTEAVASVGTFGHDVGFQGDSDGSVGFGGWWS